MRDLQTGLFRPATRVLAPHTWCPRPARIRVVELRRERIPEDRGTRDSLGDMAQVAVGTFNVNKLFSRFDFRRRRLDGRSVNREGCGAYRVLL
jgi:hypothetical protein